MKKLFASSFPCLSGRDKSFNMNTAGLLKLWHLSMTVLVAILLLGFSTPVIGQAVNATLLGTVTDSSGAAVANVKVTITETNTGISHASQTNDSGNYVFPDLPPGTYKVLAEQPGFKRESRAGIDLIVNSTERIDLVLQPGNVSETITVEAETPILQTERADTGRKLEAVLTENIPLGTNRNFQNLLNIVPGTTRATFQHSQFFNASSSLQTEVNGQLRQGNNYQIEGIDDNERTGLLQIVIPPLEAIQTVDVSTSNFDAELGRASGAVTNVMLFFFADYLKVFDHEANPNTINIPTMAFRSGDLTAVKNLPQCKPPALATACNIYNPFSGDMVDCVPGPTSPLCGTGRTQFIATSAPGLLTVPGPNGTTVDAFNAACTPATLGYSNGMCPNVIPTALIDPISAKLMAFLPTIPPTAPNTNNYFATLPFHKDTDFVDAKVDANITEKDRLSMRFSYQRPSVFQAPIFGIAGGPAQGNFEGTGIQNTYSVGLNYNRFFSNTLVAEFRVGAGWYHNEAHNSDFGTATSTTLGIPGVNLDKTITSGIVGVTINGGTYSNPLIGFSASLPWIRSETNIDFANTWTKILGNHTVKFGADLRRIRDALLQEQTFSPRGIYTFNDTQTALNTGGGATVTSFGNNFASFLLDVPGQAGRDLATFFPNYRAWQFFTFAQDKWVVTPKFSADIGVRWEFYPPATPVAKGGFSNYNPVNNTLVVSGYGSNPDNLGIFNPVLGTFDPAVLPNGQIATFQNGFPNLILPIVPSNGIITSATSVAAAAVLKLSNLFVVNPNFKNPYVESWNAAIQRTLPGRFVLDLAYVGNHSVDTVVNYNLNAATALGVTNSGLPEASFGRTASTNLLFAGYSSSYHALQVKFDRRFSSGFATTTAYTFGKGMGFQTGDDGGLSFYINQRRDYARNDFDRTQTFVQSVVYDLPFGKGKRLVSSGVGAAILGGWRVSSFLTLMSGLPLYFTASSGLLKAPGNTQTPNLVAPVQILHGVGNGSPWFTASSFADPKVPTGGTFAPFGNVGRNFLSGPNFFNVDAALSKSIRFTERFNLDLRLEAFGATNTPQFFFNSTNGTPAGGTAGGTTLGSASFGHVTNASGGRTLQLGAKFNF